MTLTAILDADVLVYEAAVAAEEEHRWDTDLWTYSGDMAKARQVFKDSIARIMSEVKASDFRLPLTDLDRNWRLSILPTYKGNRKGIRRPLLRRELAAWVREHYADKVFLRPTLEGDDVAGILLTSPVLIPGDKVLVSIDKDMKTLPGRHYNPAKGTHLLITPEEADYWHMYQTLTGDTTDGYTGCPGIGPKKAETMLKAVEPEGVKGMWKVVAKAYRKAGLTVEDATTQARVARILRYTDYDYKKKEPILWIPPTLKKKKKKRAKRP